MRGSKWVSAVIAVGLLSVVPVLLLAMLAALTYWLDQAVQSSPADAADKRLLHHPDFTAETLLATRMDARGRIRDTLRSAKMVHYLDDDSTTLEHPHYVNLTRSEPLSVTSLEALVTSNAGNIHFRGNVVARRAASTGKPLQVNTEYLHVLPDDNIAKTNQHVTITDANMRIEAAGMELNNETRVLKLQGNVRGVYYDAHAAANGERAGSARK